MTKLELLLISWNAVLTLWLFFVKKGPKGDDGKMDYWNIQVYIHQAIDDSEFMTKLIAKINSYQLHGGNKIDDKKN